LWFKGYERSEAFGLVLSKQDEHGRWSLENTYHGRFQVDIERKGKPSKWITFLAVEALKNYLSPGRKPRSVWL